MKLLSMKPSAAQGKVLLQFEDGTKLRIPVFLASDFSLHSDTELDDETFERLKKAAGEQSAKERAVRVLSMTNISKSGLQKRLKQKGESAEDAEKAIAWLDELHFLDDRKAGEAVVQTAVAKGYGKRRIREILREKGFEDPLREQLLDDVPPMDEAIDRVIRQKIKSENPEQKEIQRAIDALLRYGHEWQEIRAGLARFRSGLSVEEA